MAHLWHEGGLGELLSEGKWSVRLVLLRGSGEAGVRAERNLLRRGAEVMICTASKLKAS